MGKTIAITNQKGGVGKTTTAINLGAALAECGKKILVIDADPQGNLTSGFGVNKNEVENTVYELMLGDCSTEEAILKQVKPGVDLIASNVNLAAVDIELMDDENRNTILRDSIDWVKDKYDFIILDCPPSLSMLPINAMTAADTVLVPVQCEYYALEGLGQLIHTINLVKNGLNPDLQIEGVVFTMYDSRTNLSAQVVESVKENLQETRVYETLIPRSVKLAESPSYGQPITEYDSKSAGAEAYRKLAKEVIGTNR